MDENTILILYKFNLYFDASLIMWRRSAAHCTVTFSHMALLCQGGIKKNVCDPDENFFFFLNNPLFWLSSNVQIFLFLFCNSLLIKSLNIVGCIKNIELNKLLHVTTRLRYWNSKKWESGIGLNIINKEIFKA